MNENLIGLNQVNYAGKTQQNERGGFLRGTVAAGTTITGAVAGGYYGFKHPSEEIAKKLSNLRPTMKDHYSGIAKCFDLKKAGEELGKKQITKETFDKVKDFIDKTRQVLSKEHQVSRIANTQLKKRAESLQQATKEANLAHLEFYKAYANISSQLKELAGKGIFNQEGYTQLFNAAKQKGKEVIQIMAKPIGKAALIGAGVGLLTGIGINALFKNSNNHKTA